jgi:hypothetical protein
MCASFAALKLEVSAEHYGESSTRGVRYTTFYSSVIPPKHPLRIIRESSRLTRRTCSPSGVRVPPTETQRRTG